MGYLVTMSAIWIWCKIDKVLVVCQATSKARVGCTEIWSPQTTDRDQIWPIVPPNFSRRIFYKIFGRGTFLSFWPCLTPPPTHVCTSTRTHAHTPRLCTCIQVHTYTHYLYTHTVLLPEMATDERRNTIWVSAEYEKKSTGCNLRNLGTVMRFVHAISSISQKDYGR